MTRWSGMSWRLSREESRRTGGRPGLGRGGRLRRQDGAVLAMTALWLPLLLVLTLCAAAAGRLLLLRQQLYDAAEAAALAAVRQLDPAARARGELRLDPAGAAAAAQSVAAANLTRLPDGDGAVVSVAVRQAEPPPAIGRTSRGGRSVAGQEEPPSASVSIRLPVSLPVPGGRLTLVVTAWAGLRPEQR